MKIPMTLRQVIEMAICALRRNNASGALGLLEDTLSAMDAHEQEEANDAEETPTQDVGA